MNSGALIFISGIGFGLLVGSLDCEPGRCRDRSVALVSLCGLYILWIVAVYAMTGGL